MSQDRKHPHSEIRDAVRYAELKGWTVILRKRGHAWGQMFCPFNDKNCRCGQFCRISIWSTPRNAANHARQIRKAVDKCIWLNQPKSNQQDE